MSNKNEVLLRRLSSVITRIKAEHELSSDIALAKEMGYNRSSLSQIKSGIVPLTDSFLKVLKTYDDRVNVDYITKGIGGIFVTDTVRADAIGIDYAADGYYSPEITQGKCDLAIRVPDSSFAPRYASGDILMCKSMENAYDVIIGMYCHLKTSKNLPLIVRVCDVSGDTIKVSLNNANDMVLTLSIADIECVYRVVGFLRFEV